MLVDVRDKRFAVLEWARRAGKDMSCYIYAIQRMVEETIGVTYIFPTAEQGYNSFWNNIENDGFRTIEHIPQQMIQTKTSTKDDMSMVLRNGSTLTLLGSNAKPDKLRGGNPKLYIISEFVDTVPGLLGIIRPVVTANDGQIIINGTPKQDGVSGATFIKLRKNAEKDPTQYTSKVYGSEYLTTQQLEQARQDCIAEYGNDFMFKQEYLLDEGMALATSYYGNILAGKEKTRAIGDHPYNAAYPVYTAWDLGMGDSTAGVFWQYHHKKLNIIDAYETHDTADELVVQYIKSKPYNYAWHFFPHDGANRDSDSVQRIVKFQRLGLANCSLLRRRNKEQALRDSIALQRDVATTWHRPFTGHAIDKIKLYKRKFNKFTGDYEGPKHDSASHYGDSIQYMSDAIKQYFRDDGIFMIETKKEVDQEPEDLVTTSIYGSDDWDF
jgi:hypothetical protein